MVSLILKMCDDFLTMTRVMPILDAFRALELELELELGLEIRSYHDKALSQEEQLLEPEGFPELWQNSLPSSLPLSFQEICRRGTHCQV
jgi:hypothetical protein